MLPVCNLSGEDFVEGDLDFLNELPSLWNESSKLGGSESLGCLPRVNEEFNLAATTTSGERAYSLWDLSKVNLVRGGLLIEELEF